MRALLVECAGVQGALVLARNFKLGVRPLAVKVARDLAEERAHIFTNVPLVLALVFIALFQLFFILVFDDAGRALIDAHGEDMDRVTIAAAGKALGTLVDCDTVDVGFFFASTQLLDALAGVGVEEANQRSLLRGRREKCARLVETESG